MRIPVLILSVVLLSGCSQVSGYFKAEAPPPRKIWPSARPLANVTDFTPVLVCVGQGVDRSPVGPIDIFISPVTDDTKPFDAVGLLTTNSTMMATTALDRFSTNKISVVGRQVPGTNRQRLQLVAAYTELNRTIDSKALGGALGIGDVTLDLGRDANWNHLALDLALTMEGRLIPNSSASVMISVLGENGEANLRVRPADDIEASIAVSVRSQEGVHAAQRLLLEAGLAAVMARLYGVDYRACLSRRPDPMESERNAGRHLDRVGTVPAPPVPSKSTAPARRNEGQTCLADTAPFGGNWHSGKWSYVWDGECQNDVAHGPGKLTWRHDGKTFSVIEGTMGMGQWLGKGGIVWQDGRAYAGSLSGDEAGVLTAADGQKLSARLDPKSGRIDSRQSGNGVGR